MNVLFIHQNFPAQYVHAARWLGEHDHKVVAIGQEGSGSMRRVQRIEYVPDLSGLGALDLAYEFELSARNGLAVARACEELKADGFTPDLVVGHGGWGETLFIKDVFPVSPLINYFEFHYSAHDSDMDFDPEFPPGPDDNKRVRLRNAVNGLTIEACDLGQSPTRWQHGLFPASYQSKIAIAHEGVDVNLVRPDPTARVFLSDGTSLSAQDEVVTFSARNLEPYRGFHSFIRGLPEILARQPNAHALILGGDGVSYGRRPEDAPNWREKMIADVGPWLDLSRVHFLGRVPFRQYLSVLQISSVHVYLTYPFVLSWSLIEALAAGAAVVASNTGPVREVLEDGVNGRLTPFADPSALAANVVELLGARDAQRRLRAAARRTALERYDMREVCLPMHIKLWQDLTGQRLAPPSRGATPKRDRAATETLLSNECLSGE